MASGYERVRKSHALVPRAFFTVAAFLAAVVAGPAHAQTTELENFDGFAISGVPLTEPEIPFRESAYGSQGIRGLPRFEFSTDGPSTPEINWELANASGTQIFRNPELLEPHGNGVMNYIRSSIDSETLGIPVPRAIGGRLELDYQVENPNLFGTDLPKSKELWIRWTGRF
jgi:hypothetical protein